MNSRGIGLGTAGPHEGLLAIPGFAHVYLEDSWVLSTRRSQVRSSWFDVALLGTLSWSEQGAPPALDAAGEPDLGSIDRFEVEGARCQLSGDFALIKVESDPAALELTE